MKQTTRTGSASIGLPAPASSPSAVRMAFIISVPPLPYAPDMTAFAWATFSGVAGKSNQVKGLVLAQVVERAQDGLLGRLQREPPHRPGGVHDKNELARDHGFVWDFVRWLEDEGKVATGLVRVRQHRVFNTRTGDFVFENKIFVGQNEIICELNAEGIRPRSVGKYFVRG